MGDNDNNNGQDNNNKNNDKGNNNNQQNQNQQDNKGQNQQDNKGQNQKNNNVADNGNGNNNANEGQALSNESSVIAPGPWLIDFTVGFLLFVALAIFPMSILGRKFRKSRKARRRKKEAKKKLELETGENMSTYTAPTQVSSIGDMEKAEIFTADKHALGRAASKAAIGRKSRLRPRVGRVSTRTPTSFLTTDLHVAKSDIENDRDFEIFYITKEMKEQLYKSRNSRQTASQPDSASRKAPLSPKSQKRKKETRIFVAKSALGKTFTKDTTSTTADDSDYEVFYMTQEMKDQLKAEAQQAIGDSELQPEAEPEFNSMLGHSRHRRSFMATQVHIQKSSRHLNLDDDIEEEEEESEGVFYVTKEMAEKPNQGALGFMEAPFSDELEDADEDPMGYESLVEGMEDEEDVYDVGAYDDYFWDELPSHIQKEAIVLGYEKEMWNGGGTPPTRDKNWSDLSERERRAAAIIGYNQKFWDEGGLSQLDINDLDETTRGWKTFRNVVRFDKESRKILKISVPATIEAGLGALMHTFEIAVISSYLGPDSLTAAAMVDLAYTFNTIVSSGLRGAEEILLAQAIGMHNYYLAGSIAQLSTLIYVLFTIPMGIIWTIHIRGFILWFGLSEDIAQLASVYVPISFLGEVLGTGIADMINNMLRTDGKNWQMAVIDTVFELLSFGATVLGVVKFNLDLIGIAWLSVVSSLVYGAFLFSFSLRQGWLQPFLGGLFGSVSLKNGRLVRRMMKLALPTSFSEFLSTGDWSLLTAFAVSLGESQGVAWYISGAIWDCFEYAPEGISSAAIIRVGYHLGSANPRMAKISAYKALLYSFIWSTILTLIFIGESDNIISFFTDDVYIANLLVDVVYVIGAGNVIMCLGNLSMNILAAQSRPKIAVWIYGVVGKLLTTLPLAAYWTFGKHYNIIGIVCAVIIGYASVTLVLLTYVVNTNWKKCCCKIISVLAESDKCSSSI